MLLAIYGAALLKNPNKREGRIWAKDFHKRLKQTDARLSEISIKNYRAALLMSYMGINGKTLEKLRDKRLYRFIRRKV